VHALHGLHWQEGKGRELPGPTIKNNWSHRVTDDISPFRSAIFLLCWILMSFVGVTSEAAQEKPGEFQKFSAELKGHFQNLGWKDLDIEKIDWQYYRNTRGNRPLIFTSFGKSSKKVALFLAGVHGDESPSVYILFRLAQFLKKNPELYSNKMIVIAPLVNPDGFLSRPQTRTNSAGVDINRNFPTKNWKQSVKDRYYSGPHANSESETKFQIALMNRFKPSRILSIHSPLGCNDYDGPSSDLDSLVIWLKKVSRENGLPFRRYQVFPGSLGNYAGMERRIDTLTLELPSSEPLKGPEYFDQFKRMFLDILELNP
jgi:murein peptide amidase A